MVKTPTSDDIVEMAKKYKPWAGSWWNALIQGLLALGLGLLLWFNSADAARILGQFLALYLFVSGLFAIEAGPRMMLGEEGGKIAYYKGVAGALIGGVLIVLLIMQWVTPDMGLILLGVGLLIYGVVGLYQAFAGLKGNSRILTIIASALFLFLGISALFLREAGIMRIWVAPTLMVLGVGLIVMAFIRRSNMQKAKAKLAGAYKPAS